MQNTTIEAAYATIAEINAQRETFISIREELTAANSMGVEMSVMDTLTALQDVFTRLDEQERRVRHTLEMMPTAPDAPLARDATGGLLCLGDRVRRCGSTDALGVARITALSAYKGQAVIEVRQGEADSLWYAHAVVRVP